MKTDPSKLPFIILASIALVLACITFTPLVIPYGIHKPSLLSLPYTLWTGLIVALIFVFLTYLATRVQPGEEEDES